MKMINGQLPTWYVIKRISEDERLYAKAPSSFDNYEARASFYCNDVELEYTKDGDSWVPWKNAVTTRDDWTLYRRGRKKRKVAKGSIGLGDVHYDAQHAHLMGYNLVCSNLAQIVGDYDIIAIPVKS